MKIGDRVQVLSTTPPKEGTILAVLEFKIPGNPAKLISIKFDDGSTVKIHEHLLKVLE